METSKAQRNASKRQRQKEKEQDPVLYNLKIKRRNARNWIKSETDLTELHEMMKLLEERIKNF